MLDSTPFRVIYTLIFASMSSTVLEAILSGPPNLWMHPSDKRAQAFTEGQTILKKKTSNI